MKRTSFLLIFFFFKAQSAQCIEEQRNLPEGFVYLREKSPSIFQIMSYATTQNFTGQIVPGYNKAECVLTERAAIALSNVEKNLNAEGYGLVVFDCYRPQKAVGFFKGWVEAPEKREGKNFYFPNVNKNTLISKGYIAARSSHSRGSTVDVGLRALNLPITSALIISRCDQSISEDFIGGQLNMGTTFDCFSHRSESYSTDVPIIAQKNRKILLRAMYAQGFSNYAAEWWHFTLQAEPFKNQYFDFAIE